MPNVTAPDGTVVAFPDSMSQDDILGIMHKQFPVGGSGHADPSYWDDLKAGANSAMSTTGTALQGVGGILQRNGLPGGETVSDAGEFLKRNAPSVAPDYHNRGSDIMSHLGQGEFSEAAKDVLHGVASSAAQAAAAIGAGALGTTVGAPAMAGAGLVGGVMGLGAGAGERAAAEGKAAPDTGDVVRALPRAAADAILSGIGPGKLAARSGTALTRAATMGGASAAQSGVDQFDTTGKVDPAQVANAGIIGAATAGATELPGAVRGGAKATTDSVMSRVEGTPENPADQASLVRFQKMVGAEQVQNPELSNTAAANRVKTTLVEQAQRILNQNKGLIERDDYRDLAKELDAAQRHNNTVNDGTFTLIESLPIAADQKAALSEYTRDLNTASTQSFIKNTTGPLQKGLGLVGRVGSIGAGIASGNPYEMAAGLMGHSIAGKAGSMLGAGMDRALGLNTPPALLRAQAAARALKAAGQDPNAIQPTPMPQMPQAAPPGPPMGGQQGPVNMAPSVGVKMTPPDPVTGLPPTPVPVNTPIPMNGGPKPSLPTFRPNTPQEAMAAMAADDMGLPPSRNALQAAQQAQATQGAPAAPTSPTGLQAPGRGHAYVAAGNPNISAQAIHDAATHLESTGALPAGTAAGLANGIMPAQAKLIQNHLGITPNMSRNQGYAVEHSEQARTNARTYQNSVVQASANLQAAGKHAAAMALIGIGAVKTKAGKRAMRAALPPEIAADIPDWAVEHGGGD